MKMIVAIVQDKDSNRLSNQFIEQNIRATKLSSTGGFLRSGNSTFLIGIDDDRVDEVLALIKETSHTREQFMTPPVNMDVSMDQTASYPVEVTVGGATCFVLPVDAFHQF
ncbi:cyclic-di-AMP receptor [Furfurilactobacillus sp. WILCCON 0119]|uniref:cyclic-di-AMP receptor n=1 Tax=Furfurilactobacillus entadae TaxID=2922307 RepID=UPI0035E9B6C3